MYVSGFHRALLSDAAGQESYRKAINSSIRRTDAVLDVGTGTGIHALMACRAGARRVYAVEQDGVIEIAGRVCAENGFAERVVFLQSSLDNLELPEQVDVVITHQGLGRLFELLPVARDRFLKPGGVVIPRSIELFCAPIESGKAFEAVSFWQETTIEGLSFAAMATVAANSIHRWRIHEDELLGPGLQAGKFDFAACRDPRFACELEMPIRRTGVLHGIGLWYVQQLAPDVTLSTAPPCALSSEIWKNFFFPVTKPVRVSDGETVELLLETGPGGWGRVWRWTVSVRDAQGEIRQTSSQSTFIASALCGELGNWRGDSGYGIGVEVL